MNQVVGIGNVNVVCNEAEVRGPVVLGDRNIVHPRSRIVSEGGGTIIIGDCNIIEENVSIINWSTTPLVIGDNNHFEVGCVFEGCAVGNGCVIEVKATVAKGSRLGHNCVIGAQCSTRRDEHIADDTVIFGAGHERRTQTKPSSAQLILHARHLEYLNEVLRKFHTLKVFRSI